MKLYLPFLALFPVLMPRFSLSDEIKLEKVSLKSQAIYEMIICLLHMMLHVAVYKLY